MEERKHGKLKIFFGYAAGVGKTYAMLEAAHQIKKTGIDIVAGYIEPHDRPETTALMENLEVIPVKEYEYHGVSLKEFDLDAAIKRHPQIILVDELAHTNAFGSRHLKRYHDIRELLHTGIDVYTTLNVQHLESLNDIVASITRIVVKERIPDKIFDEADQVELVDIEPDDLLIRLKEGKIYHKQQALRALDNFFLLENLTALREIALRRCADRVNYIKEKDYLYPLVKEHILTCISSSLSNAKVIRTAARLAAAFHGDFTALYVETPDSKDMSEQNLKQLKDNLKLAKQLKARIVNVFGEDIAYQISEYANASGVSKVVIGRSNTRPTLFHKATFVDTLTKLSANLDIYIIPDHNAKFVKHKKFDLTPPKLNSKDCLITSFILLIATCIGLVFYHNGIDEANIIMMYLLAVLIISLRTSSRIYGILSSGLIVIIFNFLFTIPRFSLHAYASKYPMTFFIMLISSFMASTLTLKIKAQAKVYAVRSYRTEVLLETSRKLQSANNKNEIIFIAYAQLYKLLNKTIIFYTVKNGNLREPILFDSEVDIQIKEMYSSLNEQAVAAWVYKNRRAAGKSTNTLPAANGLYYAIQNKDSVFAVIGVALDQESELTAFERSLLTTMLDDIAHAMESSEN